MLRTSSLYFCRCDKFRDPLEGSLSKLGIHGTSASDKAFTARYPIAADYHASASAQEVARGCMFVNCWHMNTREGNRMWRAYTSDPDSVVISSSAKALQRVIPPQEVTMSSVRYVPEDIPRTEFDKSSLFFYKDTSFSYECELRLLRPLREGEQVFIERPEDFGRAIQVNLRLLVHRVILNKTISDTARRRVTDLVRQFCSRATIQESSV